MVAQESIIDSLHKNTCPECKRHFMYAEKVSHRYFVACGFCGVRWEISKKTFDHRVRIKDTISYKQQHPETTDADLEFDICPECGTIIDNGYTPGDDVTRCRCCGCDLSETIGEEEPDETT